MTQVQRPHGTYNVFPCDLCGMDDPAEIEVARRYTNDQPLHVCKNCGFVYVRERRSAQDIADSWTNEIYQSSYTARIPAVKARQMFVAETIDTTIGLKDSRLCDIGGGEGQFLQMASSAEYGAKAFAIEPSAGNCAKLTTLGIESFHGTIEEFIAADDGTAKFDIATIMWTLENCQNCRTMLDAAYALLKPGGRLVIATGSRILVPFKKPLNLYLSHQVADAHCFRFSASTLEGLLAISGFEVEHRNRYLDQDVLCLVGRKTDRSQEISWTGDDWKAVVDFFQRWDRETREHYADSISERVDNTP